MQTHLFPLQAVILCQWIKVIGKTVWGRFMLSLSLLYVLCISRRLDWHFSSKPDLRLKQIVAVLCNMSCTHQPEMSLAPVFIIQVPLTNQFPSFSFSR